MGEWHLRRGELPAAERHLRAALARLTARNPNPRHGEASYLLGLVLRLRGDLAGADDAFGKAGWDGAFAAAADTARAEIAALARRRRRGAWRSWSGPWRPTPQQPAALGLGQRCCAAPASSRRRARTWRPCSLPTRSTSGPSTSRRSSTGTAGRCPGGSQTALDIAHDEARAGLLDEAVDVLQRAVAAGADRGTEPLLHYTLAWLESRRGDEAAAARHLARARAASPDYVFPARLEEIAVLEWAIGRDRDDARARYYLGNLLYDRRRYREAIALWREAARLEPGFPTVHRNLGIAEFNVLRRPERARAAYRRALRADPSDARVLYEHDQLRKRLGDAPAARLRDLEARRELVLQRDDLTVEYVTLLNRVGRHADAVAHPGRPALPSLGGRRGPRLRTVGRGPPGAGASGAARGSGRRRPPTSCATAMDYPANLGEGKHLLTPENELQLLLGHCLAASGRRRPRPGTGGRGPPSPRATPTRPPATDPTGRPWRCASWATPQPPTRAWRRSCAAARRQARAEVRIPYFATSLPTLLLFDDDLSALAPVEARYLEGLALLGMGRGSARPGHASRMSSRRAPSTSRPPCGWRRSARTERPVRPARVADASPAAAPECRLRISPAARAPAPCRRASRRAPARPPAAGRAAAPGSRA